MVAEHNWKVKNPPFCCSLAKILMVAEPLLIVTVFEKCCSLAKILMVAELMMNTPISPTCCSLAKILMVAELGTAFTLS